MVNLQSLKKSAIDIEMQKHTEHTAKSWAKDGRMAALQGLFGYSRETVEQVPSAMAWCRYLEDRFQPFVDEEYACIWKAIGLPRPKTTADCWPFFEVVASSVIGMNDAGTSIEDIWDAVESSRQVVQPTRTSPSEKSTCLIAVFAILCWGSMMLQPKLVWANPAASPCLAVEQLQSDHQGLRMDFVQRPIPAIFRNIQRSKATNCWRRPIGVSNGISTVLYVSTLNFSSLRTIGKIRLRWVDNISSHLEFDSRNRILSIFRFPSFCALTTLGETRGVLFEELSRALYSADADAGREFEGNEQLSQEVLMSYRLLFGQTRASRKLAKALLQEELGKNHDYDELLGLLCCTPHRPLVKKVLSTFWPVSCRDYNNILSEADSYSAQDDFPTFSQRLAAVQDFSLRQQPSKLRDLWRDRRNPLQWYTFWAVLIVGGASIIIGLLQLVVAIVAIPISGAICNCSNSEISQPSRIV
ncbi:hypothetical protein F5882DRAFT_149033 [Hyaloscypha sp. PMI_1271]|nr:hypothetical protein F5882DRAFT_149033 [Hyaloscypha sp. PMI_1271]